jgi:hypothetical protein
MLALKSLAMQISFSAKGDPMVRSRRRFLQTAIAPTAVVGFPMLLRGSALGAAGTVPPSDRITIGCIGTGWMGSANVGSFADEPGAQVVAVCDVE